MKGYLTEIMDVMMSAPRTRCSKQVAINLKELLFNPILSEILV